MPAIREMVKAPLLHGMAVPRLISELVGRRLGAAGRPGRRLVSRLPKAGKQDDFRPDYAFWARYRRGLEPGYELGSHFAQPALDIMVAWTLGNGFRVLTGDPDLDATFQGFVHENMNTISAWMMDAASFGDSYIMVDEFALTPPIRLSPEAVGLWDHWTAHEPRAVTITETMGGSPVTQRWDKIAHVMYNGLPTAPGGLPANMDAMREEDWLPNRLGEIPIVHLAWQRDADEVYGHSWFEPIFRKWAAYHDISRSSYAGVRVMGNPVLAIDGLDDPESTMERDRDRNLSALLGGNVVKGSGMDIWYSGRGGTTRFVAPPPFMDNISIAFRAIFLDTLHYLGIPEFVWGGAIASSKASAEAQLPGFVLTVQGWRAWLEPSLMKLLRLWNLSSSLAQEQPLAETLSIEWPPVLAEDPVEQRERISFALQSGLIRRETALAQLGIVTDPAEEARLAMAEVAEERGELESTRLTQAID